MTATTLPRKDCRQHPAGCCSWGRHGHTIRGRDDTWAAAEDASGTGQVAGWIAVAMETRLMKIRCPRCDNRDPGSPSVPLICGDMTGGTLDEWIAAAEKQVRGQHPRHEPVWLGVAPSGPAPAIFKPPAPRQGAIT